MNQFKKWLGHIVQYELIWNDSNAVYRFFVIENDSYACLNKFQW